MVYKDKILRLTRSFSIETIEKSLVYNYLNTIEIEYAFSSILTSFLRDHKPNNKIDKIINSFNITNIKELENYFELLIPKKDRKLNGAYFTPNYIIDYIINEIQPQENHKNIDLSCGAGAFLLGLVRFYKIKYNKNIKDILKNNIWGIDLLSYNYRRTKLLLAIYGLLNNEIIKEEDLNLHIGNSLKISWNQKFDNVLGNPPYVKLQDLESETRKVLNKDWQTNKKGNFNLYNAFFELGYEVLKENGKLGYITPNNYFTSLAGEPLRNFFHSKKCIYKIIDFSHIKVFDAQTYTALTFLSKNQNIIIQFDRIENNEDPQTFLSNVNENPNPLSELNPKKWRLLKNQERKIIKSIENVGTPLGHLFDIKVGIATLKDHLYFIDSDTYYDGYYIKQIQNKKFKIEPKITKVIYKISDFPDAKRFKYNKRRIIFPYKKINGKYISLSEEEIKHKFPYTYNYFYAIKNELEKRDKSNNKITPFYAYGRQQGLNSYGEKILTPTFSQKPRFTYINDKDSLFCNGYALFFKDSWKEIIDNPIRHKENVDVLLKVLNSRLMDYYITKTSVAIQGGYPCYQKNFIEHFTIPQFENEEIQQLRNIPTEKELENILISKYQLNLPEPNLFV